MRSPPPLLPPRLTLSMCFVLIGLAHVASLWFDLYRLVTISLVLALLLSLLSGVHRKRHALHVGRNLLLVAPIYAYLVISSRWSVDPGTATRDAVYTCIAVAPAVVLGLALACRYTGAQIAQGLGVMLLPFAAQALVSAIQRGDPMLVGEGSMRTVLGMAICLVSPILAGAWAATGRIRYGLLGLVALTFALTMDSRSVILFAAPASLISLYLQDKQRLYRLLGYAMVPLLIAVALLGPAILGRFSSESTSLDVGESVVEELQQNPGDGVDLDRRLTTYTAAVTFLEHPIFGRGYSSIMQIHQAEYGIELSAHGLIPGSLSEIGLVGLAVFIATVWRVWRRARVALRTDASADPLLVHFIVGLCALLALGLVHQVIESVFFGLALGMLLGFSRTKTRARRPRAVPHSLTARSVA